MVRDMDLLRLMCFALVSVGGFGTELNETRRAVSFNCRILQGLALLLLLTFLVGCRQEPPKPRTQLERVKQSGELRVATRYGPSSYYEGVTGPTGLEHDLAQLFGKRLGVKVTFVALDSAARVLRTLAEGKAEIAAAGLMIDEHWEGQVRFGPAYRRVTEQLLYGNDRRRPPRSPADLGSGLLEVSAGSSHLATLKRLKRRHPGLRWRIDYDHNVGDLAYLVNEGSVDFTIANSDQALLMRRFYPKLQIGFELGGGRELAWALPKSGDASLYDEVVRFFEDIKRDKTLDQLIDRYYGHAESFDPLLDSSLRRDYRTRLPIFKTLFVRAGKQHDIDWRLLAALAYQESKWKSTAVSKEGVRGMMMLTGETAKELKVSDRFNPAQSIAAGAFYLSQILANLPASIEGPDRLWYALAAYNLGPGHVEDARGLVRARGGDPDKWVEIKRVLPLLAKRTWYRKTKLGKARGSVAVHYVNSIRRYYDLLVWITGEEENRKLALGLERGRDDGA